MKKVCTLLVSILVIVLMMGCGNMIDPQNKADITATPTLTPSIGSDTDAPSIDGSPTADTTPEAVPMPKTLSAWVTYWDIQEEMLAEVVQLKDDLESISFFAAYFNKNNQLFIPEETTDMQEHANSIFEAGMPVKYLTIVNDRLKGRDVAILKDTDLLWDLLKTDAIMMEHIHEIVKLAKDGGYDGIEIDYEAIQNDMALWRCFIEFINRLYSETRKSELQLRILLEPGIPFHRLSFPDGPEYVIMCYNLYGYHSGPGPKADAAFIQELIKKSEAIPGKKVYAISTGGFVWTGYQKAESLTQVQAKALQEQYNVNPIRDEASLCLWFQYVDEANVGHEVWYADEITLENWASAIRDAGDYVVAIWRLGGNEGLGNILKST